MKIKTQISATLLGCLVSSPLWAHSGDLATGFVAGLLHPLTGFDHLLLLLAVGLYAAYAHKPQRLLLPSVLLASLALGALFGAYGVMYANIETGIALSVVAIGALLLGADLPRALTTMVVILIGLLHGFAHGIEAPLGLAYLTFVPAFLLTSTLVLSLGLLLGKHSQSASMQFCGKTIVAVGVINLLLQF